jgi:hypothetical protein
MAITDGATLRKMLRENPDEALKVLQHDLFGMISVIQGGALLLSEDLQQTDGYILKGLETTRQIADVVLHEAMNAQVYLEGLRGETANGTGQSEQPELE